MPFWGAFVLYMHFNVWCMFSSTKWLYIVTALCITTVSMYKFNGGTAASHFNATFSIFFVSPCNPIQALVL